MIDKNLTKSEWETLCKILESQDNPDPKYLELFYQLEKENKHGIIAL